MRSLPLVSWEYAPSVLTSPPSSVTLTLLSNCFFSISIYVNSLKSNFFLIAPTMMSILVSVFCMANPTSVSHLFTEFSKPFLPSAFLLSASLHFLILPFSLDILPSSPLYMEIFTIVISPHRHFLESSVKHSSHSVHVARPCPRFSSNSPVLWPGRFPPATTPCSHPEPPASAHMLLEASMPFHMHFLPTEPTTLSAETKAKRKAP